MIKAELIVRMARRLGITQDLAERAIDGMTGEIRDALERDDIVFIRGFGTFSVRHENAYDGRNPRTGTPVRVAATRRVKFKASRAVLKS